jgi:DNA-binding response OmpR family regulator
MIKIMLSGHPSARDRIAAIGRNADGYLVEPIEIGGSLRIIKNQRKRNETLGRCGLFTIVMKPGSLCTPRMYITIACINRSKEEL